MSGWWRRNGWALPVALIAFGVAAVPDAKSWYDAYRHDRPTLAQRPAADGWASFGGARMRLVSVTEVQPKDYSGRPMKLPPGTAAWQAELEFEPADAKTLAGCTVQLRSGSGWRYAANPQELSHVSGLDFGCTSSDPGTGARVRNQMIFLLPTNQRAGAVEITVPTLLPRFAELPAGPDRSGS